MRYKVKNLNWCRLFLLLLIVCVFWCVSPDVRALGESPTGEKKKILTREELEPARITLHEILASAPYQPRSYQSEYKERAKQFIKSKWRNFTRQLQEFLDYVKPSFTVSPNAKRFIDIVFLLLKGLVALVAFSAVMVVVVHILKRLFFKYQTRKYSQPHSSKEVEYHLPDLEQLAATEEGLAVLHRYIRAKLLTSLNLGQSTTDRELLPCISDHKLREQYHGLISLHEKTFYSGQTLLQEAFIPLLKELREQRI